MQERWLRYMILMFIFFSWYVDVFGDTVHITHERLFFPRFLFVQLGDCGTSNQIQITEIRQKKSALTTSLFIRAHKFPPFAHIDEEMKQPMIFYFSLEKNIYHSKTEAKTPW